MKKMILGLFLAACWCTDSVKAQDVAVKTNLLYDASATFNAGVEVALGQKWTIDLSGNYNPWTFSDNRKWKHWLCVTGSAGRWEAIFWDSICTEGSITQAISTRGSSSPVPTSPL